MEEFESGSCFPKGKRLTKASSRCQKAAKKKRSSKNRRNTYRMIVFEHGRVELVAKHLPIICDVVQELLQKLNIFTTIRLCTPHHTTSNTW